MNALTQQNKFLNEQALTTLRNTLAYEGSIYYPLHKIPPVILLDRKGQEVEFSIIYVFDVDQGLNTSESEMSYLIVRMAAEQLGEHSFSFTTVPKRIFVLGRSVHFTIVTIEGEPYLTVKIKSERPTPKEESQDPDLLVEKEMMSFKNQ